MPESLVLNRDALRFFLNENDLTNQVQSLLANYPGMEWPRRVAQYEQTCSRIRQVPAPLEIQEAVNPVVAWLLDRSPAGLAVRSSSICEDLEKASFAGIYESSLGVFDLSDFWQSVLQVWCSAWSPKAAAYAQKMGLDIPVDGMAVLIQPVIPASRAGVIFTADPATGNPWRFVLNATFGLASQLVDGSAPADRFVLEWDSGEILEQRIVCKDKAILYNEGKLAETDLPEAVQEQASLQADQLKAISRMALDIDRAFERRVDIEWAVAEESIYLLQVRPITFLPPFFPHQFSAEEAEETWVLVQEKPLAPIARGRSLLEMWNRYLTPDDIFPRQKGMERLIHGYYYSTVPKWSGNPSGYDRQGIERWLDANEARLRKGWLDRLSAAHQANAWLDETIEVTSHAAGWVRIALEFERLENEMHAAVWHAPQWMIFTCEDLIKAFIAEVMPDSGI
ncbi:MAG: PEP/pyruvate-binding domain-containing protein, partial [Omnitrophica WOR_2 bacterium]